MKVRESWWKAKMWNERRLLYYAVVYHVDQIPSLHKLKTYPSQSRAKSSFDFAPLSFWTMGRKTRRDSTSLCFDDSYYRGRPSNVLTGGTASSPAIGSHRSLINGAGMSPAPCHSVEGLFRNERWSLWIGKDTLFKRIVSNGCEWAMTSGWRGCEYFQNLTICGWISDIRSLGDFVYLTTLFSHDCFLVSTQWQQHACWGRFTYFLRLLYFYSMFLAYTNIWVPGNA